MSSYEIIKDKYFEPMNELYARFSKFADKRESELLSDLKRDYPDNKDVRKFVRKERNRLMKKMYKYA